MLLFSKGKVVSLYVLLLSFFLAGCSERTLDSSSPQAFENSIIEIRDSLPKTKGEEFMISIYAIQTANIGQPYIDLDLVRGEVRKQLSGKTANEVIAEAKPLIEKSEEETRRSKAKLYAKVDRLEKEASELAKEIQALLETQRMALEVIDSSYTETPKSGFKLMLLNSSGSAISKVYFSWAAFTKGRSIPWVKKELSYKI